MDDGARMIVQTLQTRTMADAADRRFDGRARSDTDERADGRFNGRAHSEVVGLVHVF